MKLTAHFTSFLNDTVNLNADRINDLETSTAAIKRFIRQSVYEPTIRSFEEQGSWAHKTIIKPVDKGEFDADLLVRVDPVHDWTAYDYVKELGKLFKDSATYGDITKVWDYCVTVTYAKDHKVDIAPLVIDRVYADTREVCNKTANDFELSEPSAYTQWLRDQNSYSGSNSFRKVTRLVKYLRDIKLTFTCPSVILTTLLGNHIYSSDQGSDEFADTPTALRTLIGRLDNWLQLRPAKPEMRNPELWSEDFGACWPNEKYVNFRKQIHRYREWIDEAYDSDDRDESIIAWRRVFGAAFAKGVTVTKKKSLAEASVFASAMVANDAKTQFDLVRQVQIYGADVIPRSITEASHRKPATWPVSGSAWTNVEITAEHRGYRKKRGSMITNGEPITPVGGILFQAFFDGMSQVPGNCHVKWRITNTGWAAFFNGCSRGGFYPSDGNKRWEPLEYHGVHIAEVFLIGSDGTLRGRSAPFHVVIN